MNKKQKKLFIRITASALLFCASLIPRLPLYCVLILLALSYAVIGYDILKKAVTRIFRGQMMDENFLMSVATVGAAVTGEYHEAVAVMLFYQVGELFQSIAVGKSRKSISELMSIRPDSADVIRNGETITVSPEQVGIGETTVVRPGGRIPLDGVITDGNADIDTSALTGESLPVHKVSGDAVVSGSVVLDGVIYVKTEKEYSESSVSKILELTENASVNKANSEKFITRFAKVYTPVVVISALLLASVPPIFVGHFTDWLYRAMTFLVISCPCALVISVPLTFFCGIGGLSKKGILVKGGEYIEALAECKTAVFDKTGTLTEGHLEVSDVIPNGIEKDELLKITAIAESFSTHPVASAIVDFYGKPIDKNSITDVKEYAGLGISASVSGKTVRVGNSGFITPPKPDGFGTFVHTEINGAYAGCICLRDTVKKNSPSAISELCKLGVGNIVMLTGDRQNVAKSVAETLGITNVYSELLPQDKVSKVKELTENVRPKKLMFTGDGINDAPVLAMSDVGIAMGALGSDAAIEAADVVIMDDDPKKIALAVKMSRKICKTVRQNIIFVLFVKVCVLILGALGLASMWSAVFADVGVAIIAIVNSIYSAKSKKSAL